MCALSFRATLLLPCPRFIRGAALVVCPPFFCQRVTAEEKSSVKPTGQIANKDIISDFEKNGSQSERTDSKIQRVRLDCARILCQIKTENWRGFQNNVPEGPPE